MELIELLRIATPLLAIGGAWGGAKVALNGTRNRVKTLETRFEEHDYRNNQRHLELIDRLARIETKLEN